MCDGGAAVAALDDGRGCGCGCEGGREVAGARVLEGENFGEDGREACCQVGGDGVRMGEEDLG